MITLRNSRCSHASASLSMTWFWAFAFSLLLPLQALAYQVPERDYWRAFTLSLINASREEHGLSVIGLDSSLNELAQGHANDSATHYDDATPATRRATYIVHVSSDGRTLGDRVKDEGITGARRFGENVGLRYSSGFVDLHGAIEEALNYMHAYIMAEVPPDDGHRVTLLTPTYTHVGIGLELHREEDKSPNTLFFVTDFAEFTDGREVVIPPLGKHPVSPPKESVPSIELRYRRVRQRTINRLQRRTIVPSSPEEPLSLAKTLKERTEERRLQRLKNVEMR